MTSRAMAVVLMSMWTGLCLSGLRPAWTQERGAQASGAQPGGQQVVTPKSTVEQPGQDETGGTDRLEAYRELAKQLDSAEFSQRQVASNRLSQAGAEAIPALIEAANSESRERTVRAIEILKRHFESGNNELKAAARSGLEKIAAAAPEAAAGRAKAILEPPTPPPAQFPMQRAVPLQIQIQGFAGGRGHSMTTRVVNGVKTITVKENGGRRIEIQDDPNQGIKITTTETKDGKEVKKVYEAKNEEDLKKKSADGHKIYQQYSKGNAAIQLMPLQNAFQARLRNRPNKRADALKQLDEALESLKAIQATADDQEKLKKAIDKIEAARKAFNGS